MKVLVTGHDGYIGSVLAPMLIATGHTVEGVDSFFFESCDVLPDRARVAARRADIRDIAAEDLQGFNAVVHLAALSNDPMGDLKREWTEDINYRATKALAKAAKAAGVQRFVYASSCSMYGASDSDEMVNEEAPLKPLTAYAEAKVRSEESLTTLADEEFSPVLMRNATAYGVSPKLRADIVLNNLVAWAYTTGTIRILSDGTPWRPLVHVEDICKAIVAMLDAPREQIHNQAFNIGATSENYQVRELAEIVKGVLPDCEIEYAGSNKPDPRSYRVDFSKLARTFPEARLNRTVRYGAMELLQAYRGIGLTRAQFESRKYIRLRQLQHLLETGQLDDTLRFRSPRRPAGLRKPVR